LPCTELPCKYLGLPFSIKELFKADFCAIIHKIPDRLPGWKAVMMHPARRATLVRAVLGLGRWSFSGSLTSLDVISPAPLGVV